MQINDEGVDSSKYVDPRTEPQEESSHQHSEASLSSSLPIHPSQPLMKKARNARRDGSSVRFAKIEYKEPEEPLTEEERSRYFWSEADSRILKLERRSLIHKYKRKLHFHGASFWAETDESVRGLEDHTADFCGYPSSFKVRREHERRVMREVYQQWKTGKRDDELLREVSHRSSTKSRLRALDRAQEDFLEVQSLHLYQCPIEASLLWDSDKESVFSDSKNCSA
ncbi:hypothetical protein ACA910_014612 [Epithemia clementina (nom. ined.)]